MTRGTTPTIVFTCPFSVSAATVMSIAFSQSGHEILEKTLTDVTISGTKITLELSQADTLLFDARFPVEMQIRMILDGKAMASSIMSSTRMRLTVCRANTPTRSPTRLFRWSKKPMDNERRRG